MKWRVKWQFRRTDSWDEGHNDFLSPEEAVIRIRELIDNPYARHLRVVRLRPKPELGCGLNTLRDRCFQQAKDKGWHEKEASFGDRIALCHSELSEALEEFRDGAGMDETYHTEDGKPEGIPTELADTIIRILDMCGLYGIDIEKAVENKLAYNATRPHRHGGKVL